MEYQRKRFLVDNFQTKLFLRIGMYWLIYQFTTWNILLIWRLLTEGNGDPLGQIRQVFLEQYPTLIIFVLIVPFLCWDAVKFSHRLVGPIKRFRNTFQSVAKGEKVKPIRLREGDFLVEMQNDFNDMLQSLENRGADVLQDSPEDGKSVNV